jgi:hypothetical protein
MRRTSVVRALAVALAVGIGQAAFAADTPTVPTVPETPGEAAATPAEPVVEQDAVDALKAMGTYLRTLKAFEVTSDFTLEETLDDGQKIMNSGSADYLARLPDRLAVALYTDTAERQFFYDGKTLTMYGPKIGYYASVPAPATIAETLDMAYERYGLEVPLADLFTWGTDDDGTADLTSAFFVGVSQIGDVACDHYAFRQEGADWQLWIEPDDTPLPCKIVITATDDQTLPQYVSRLTWTLDPPIDDAAFVFTPPEGAQKIPLKELPPDGDAAGGDQDG